MQSGTRLFAKEECVVCIGLLKTKEIEVLEIHFKESDILKLKEKSMKTLLKSKEKKEHDEHNTKTHTVQQRKLQRQTADKNKNQQQQNTIVKVHKQKRKHTKQTTLIVHTIKTNSCMTTYGKPE